MESQEKAWLLKEKYGGVKSEAFHADCARLTDGEPLAYIIGSVPFLNTTIFLDSKPLIPRPETEFWTEQAINEIAKFQSPTPTILDLCAGSGAIGVAVAKQVPSSLVDFGEIDPIHVPTIGKNLEDNAISRNRYHVWESDLFEHVSGHYDFILSNPPYIDPKVNRTETSVTEHEPHKALYGGNLGLECIINIITEAPNHLAQSGQLWIEHEPEQACAIMLIGTKNGFTAHPQLDQFEVVRYTVLTID